MKKNLLLLVLLGLLLVCGAGAEGVCDHDGWLENPEAYISSITEEHHFLTCPVCNVLLMNANHYVTCDQPGVCTICGAACDRPKTHVGGSEMIHDDELHYQICMTCGDEIICYAHTAYCYAPTSCKDCSYVGEQRVAHRYQMGEADYVLECDAEYEYRVCGDCGEVFDKAPHGPSYCNAPGICISCQGPYATETVHISGQGQGYLQSDKTHHWRRCFGCEEIISYEPHYYYCDQLNKAVCGDGDCGVQYETAEVRHRKTIYAYDANGHEVRCANLECREVLEAGPHRVPCGTSYCKDCPCDEPETYVTIHEYINPNNACAICGKKNPVEKFSITSHPADAVVPAGQTASVSVAAEGSGLQYQWYVREIGAKEYVKTTVKTSTYSWKAATDTLGCQAYCVVTDSTGASLESKVAILRAKEVVYITQQPDSAKVPFGATAEVSVKATGEGLTYQWYVRNADQSISNDSPYYPSTVTGSVYSCEMTEKSNGRYLYCVVTDAFGNSIASAKARMHAYHVVEIITQPVETYADAGETVRFSVEAVSDEQLRYKWQLTLYNGGSIFYRTEENVLEITMDQELDRATVSCQVSTVDDISWADSDRVKLYLRKTLKILKQPETAMTVIGDTARVSVEAVGDEIHYQWYVRNPGAEKFGRSSVTDKTYTVTMREAIAGREVYCVVTDAYYNQVQSDIVTLEMDTAVRITAQPRDAYAYAGEKVRTSVTAVGADLRYQWYVRNAGETEFTVSAVKSSTYSATMSDKSNGREVYCVVTNAYGEQVKTDTAVLRQKTKLMILNQPEDVMAASGEKVKTSVKAQGDGLTYQWYFASAKATKFSKASIVSDTYSVTMTASRNGRRIYCVITDAYGNSVQTDTVTLKMIVPVEITQQPKDVYVASGAKARTTVTATGEGLSYQWYVCNAGEAEFAKSSVKTRAYSTTMSAKSAGRQLYCVVTDAYGNSVQTDIITLHEKAKLAIITQPEDVIVASGKKATTSVKAQGDGLTYQWYFASAKATKFSKASIISDTYSVTMTAARDGRRIYCVITDMYGNSVQTDTVTLRMK